MDKVPAAHQSYFNFPEIIERVKEVKLLLHFITHDSHDQLDLGWVLSRGCSLGALPGDAHFQEAQSSQFISATKPTFHPFKPEKLKINLLLPCGWSLGFASGRLLEDFFVVVVLWFLIGFSPASRLRFPFCLGSCSATKFHWDASLLCKNSAAALVRHPLQ